MKRLLGWTIVLILLAALYSAGLAFGHPIPAYSPSTLQKAWLNPQTDYHPDEFAYVGLAYQMLLKHEWNPHYYHNPSLNIYTNLGVFWASGAQDQPHNVNYGQREIAPFQLYVMARYLSALYTLLAVVLTYAAGRVGFNRQAGGIAAALVGLSPLMTQHAHYATPNAQTTMLATAALLAGLVILKGRDKRRLRMEIIYFTGGLLVGLTMAARYNAAIVGLVVGLAMVVAWWRHRRWLPVLLGFAAMPLGFALGTPGIIFATREVIDQIRQIMRWYRVQGGGPGFTTHRGLEAFYYHWRYITLIALGPATILLALIGLVMALTSGVSKPKDKTKWEAWIGGVLALYMLVYTILALPGKRIQSNLLFPLFAPLALLASYAIVKISGPRKRRREIAVGLTLLMVTWPAILSAAFAYRLAVPDNRERAQEWVYNHVPRGSTVYLLGPYNVPLDPLDYRTQQTYGGEAKPEKVQQSKAQIIIYSDAYPFVTLRDPKLSGEKDKQREVAIKNILQTEWIELARFKRMPWPGAKLAPDDISYWHQMEIVIYCNPANCPAK